MDDLKAPCFVRIKHPLTPHERGRQLLISVNRRTDECRVGLRGGHIGSYLREELEIAEESNHVE